MNIKLKTVLSAFVENISKTAINNLKTLDMVRAKNSDIFKMKSVSLVSSMSWW